MKRELRNVTKKIIFLCYYFTANKCYFFLFFSPCSKSVQKLSGMWLPPTEVATYLVSFGTLIGKLLLGCFIHLIKLQFQLFAYHEFLLDFFFSCLIQRPFFFFSCIIYKFASHTGSLSVFLQDYFRWKKFFFSNLRSQASRKFGIFFKKSASFVTLNFGLLKYWLWFAYFLVPFLCSFFLETPS